MPKGCDHHWAVWAGPQECLFLFSLTQFQIRALESQKRQQEIVLRRKTQEVRKVGFLLIVPSSHGGLGPSAWLGEIPSFRQGRLWEWGSQKGREGRNGVGNGCRQQQSSPSQVTELELPETDALGRLT